MTAKRAKLDAGRIIEPSIWHMIQVFKPEDRRAQFDWGNEKKCIGILLPEEYLKISK